MIVRFKLNGLFHWTIRGLFFSVVYVSVAHADNPCGVGCTQTIASNAASDALNAANSFSESAIQAAINSRVYEKVIVFAENSGNIFTGSTDWSFGHSDIGRIGVPMVGNWELFGFSIQARAVSTPPTTVTINVLDQNTLTILHTFVATLTSSPGSYTEQLNIPVAVLSGATIGFATVSVSSGTVTGARVAAWLRRHPD